MKTEQVSTLKVFFVMAFAFALLFGLLQTFIYGLNYALVSAPIAGIVFSLTIYFFVNSKKVKQQTAISETDAADVVYAGAANHFKNGEAVGGKLYLLNGRLEFKSHQYNIQNRAFIINLNEIEEITFYNTLGLVPNGLKLSLKDGEVEKFVVNNRALWKAEIEQQMVASV